MAGKTSQLKRWRTWLLAAIVVVLIVGGWGAWRLTRRVPVEVASVQRGTIREYVEEQAKTRVPETTAITTPFDGRIEPVNLIEGESVQAGEVVARMEMNDLNTRIAEAEARVAEIEARITETTDARLERTLIEQINSALESIDHTVAAAEEQTRAGQAALAYYTDELERLEKAEKAGAATPLEVSRARLNKIQSDVQLKEDYLTLRAAEAIQTAARIAPRFVKQMIEKKSLTREVLERQRAQAQAALEKLRLDQQRAAMTSPVDGVVFDRVYSSKRELPAGTTVLEIGRLEDLEVEIEMLTEDVRAVRAGDTVDIFGPVIGEHPMPGTVSRIYPQAFEEISSLGVEQQRVLVIVKPDSQSLQQHLASGSTFGAQYRVRTRVYTEQADEALIVPRTALFRSETGTWQVFVARHGTARRIDVHVGISTPDRAQIVSGLNADDRVVLAPPADLTNGSRLHVVRHHARSSSDKASSTDRRRVR